MISWSPVVVIDADHGHMEHAGLRYILTKIKSIVFRFFCGSRC